MDKIFVLDKKYFVLDKINLSWTNLILSRQMDRALVYIFIKNYHCGSVEEENESDDGLYASGSYSSGQIQSNLASRMLRVVKSTKL